MWRVNKNLNKECPILIKGDISVDDYIRDKNLNDIRFAEGLKNIRENELGKLLYFGLSYIIQYINKKSDEIALRYVFSLEHIMPKNWEKNWSIDVLPVIDVESNEIITDEERAIEIRDASIYELGNMALLSGSLNSAISDYDFSRKIEGDTTGKLKKKEGIRAYAMLTSSRKVVETYDANGVWNEVEIRKRTNQFMKDIIKVWPIND
ncbi:hypothetical protein P261_02592 [Lachnospiraceae bacterium TWA4]|nr:hypothetical protein P261_02592 [Lachnospiraceae bacterium TWA4]